MMAGANLKLPGSKESERPRRESWDYNQVNGIKDQIQDKKHERVTNSYPGGLQSGCVHG